ncbi:MAG TPA: TIM barrel protein [Prolixibacteraceae bacterium]|nr:TIM barrel protein [Prolixibacteraceae bacterium]
MIKNLSYLVIALLLSSTLISCEKKVDKEIGLQLWSVREDMRNDAAATIQEIGKIGYDFVEAAGYADGKFYGMDPLEFKKLLNDNGIEFLASHTGKALPDSATWSETMEWWDVCIDAHKAAGVKYIVQPFMDQKGYGSIEDLQSYCEYFNIVGEKCNSNGIRFGYHNHDGEFNNPVDGMVRYDYMLQNTDPEKVFFQPDLYWIVVGGKNPIEYFTNYPGRFLLWHVKDEKELGESGNMDFESMFALAEMSGMQHLIVEVEQYDYEPLVSVKMSYDFLMKAEYVK